MRQSLYNNTRARESLPVAARTATANGSSVDRTGGPEGGFRSAMLVAHTGTITDGTHTIEFQESDDDSTFTAVPDEDLEGTEPAIGVDDDNDVFEIGYLGHKRYLRARSAVTGATSGGTYGALILLGYAKHAPLDRS